MPPSYRDFKNFQGSEGKEIFAKNRIMPTGGATRLVLRWSKWTWKTKINCFSPCEESIFIQSLSREWDSDYEIHECFIYFGQLDFESEFYSARSRISKGQLLNIMADFEELKCRIWRGGFFLKLSWSFG